MKILYVLKGLDYLLSHRRALIISALKAGHEVHVAAPPSEKAAVVRALGAHVHTLPYNPHGMNPFFELKMLFAMYRLYRKIKPDLAHHLTIKPMLYGSLVARAAGTPAVVNAVTGMGYVFLKQGVAGRIIKHCVMGGYRFAFKLRNHRIIFQNPDDRDFFINHRLVRSPDTVIIRGSGVDPDEYAPSEEPQGPPCVILPARLLIDKGVREFAEAARILREQGVGARFALVGDSEKGNPSAVPDEEIRAWVSEGLVEWWGHRDDMPKVYSQAHIVCLPSYREGLPRVLLEAASSSRPLVAFDVPGCREIVRHATNGFLVPAKDARALVDALRQLILSPDLRRTMGARGRLMIENEFSDASVNRQTMDVYLLLHKSSPATQS